MHTKTQIKLIHKQNYNRKNTHTKFFPNSIFHSCTARMLWIYYLFDIFYLIFLFNMEHREGKGYTQNYCIKKGLQFYLSFCSLLTLNIANFNGYFLIIDLKKQLKHCTFHYKTQNKQKKNLHQNM